MKAWSKSFCAAACVILVNVNTAEAQSVYQISVQLDESTTADDDLLTAAAYAAPLGDVSQSVRKLAAGLVGEVQLLLTQRLDRDGLLTLDDETVVPVAEGDLIEVRKARKCEKDCPGGGGSNGVVIFRKGPGRPDGILFVTDAGCRLLSFVEHGRPVFSNFNCPPR